MSATTTRLTAPPLPQALGAPGVYFTPEVSPRRLVAEPMDVTAFVGVAARGPAWEPIEDSTLVDEGTTRARSVAVAVDSWDDYVERFGSFDAPSLLPHAVAAFFAQGGRRAYVVRVVHDSIAFEDGALMPLGCARFELVLGPAVVRFRARNEGAWGNRLEITMAFTPRPLAFVSASGAELVLEAGSRAPAGALVRLRATDGTTVMRWVNRVRWRGIVDAPGRDLVATLDQPVGFAVARAELVDVDLDVVDRDPAHARREHLADLGLQPAHPRWIAGVVRDESRLVELIEDVPSTVSIDAGLEPRVAALVVEGEDRWDLVTPNDIFGRLLEGDESGTDGLEALLGAPEVATVVVPDLYSPVELPSDQPVAEVGVFAGPSFAPCLAVLPAVHPPPPARPLTGLHLDPASAADLELIVHFQQQLVAVAERLRLVALLDVPPGLRQRAILRWRSRFDSSYAAAYHPWVLVPREGAAGGLIALNPSAVAAGVIARCELRQGVPRGPANEPAWGVVDLTDRLDDERHGELHQNGVDVFRRQPDAIWLTGARTLSTDRQWRQLSVRRLLLLIERSVARQLQWTVFEPNDAMLRAGLRRMLDHLLAGLFAQGAFAGATPAQSWFVHVASGADLAREADLGQLVVEIGVAPTEPTEFIIVRVSIDAEGAVETSLRVGAGVLGDG